MIKIQQLMGIGALILLSGCAGSTPATLAPTPAIVGIPGIYHRVERGQTLWSISKSYDCDIEDLARANDISDTTKIEVGQSIFIPNRKKAISPISKSTTDDFMWPLRGRVIHTFGSVTGTIINKGINIEPLTTAEVVAARSGKVAFCSDDFENFGKTLIIDHEDGFFTVYARAQEIIARLGQKVQKGEVVARVSSGGQGKGSYLHFEIRKKHLPQNPYFYLP